MSFAKQIELLLAEQPDTVAIPALLEVLHQRGVVDRDAPALLAKEGVKRTTAGVQAWARSGDVLAWRLTNSMLHTNWLFSRKALVQRCAIEKMLLRTADRPKFRQKGRGRPRKNAVLAAMLRKDGER